MRSDPFRLLGLILALATASVGVAWAARGYVDERIVGHGHSDLASSEDVYFINEKLDDIRDRLARIEGELKGNK